MTDVFPASPEFPEAPEGTTPATPPPVPVGSDLTVPRDALPEQVVTPWTGEIVDLTDPGKIAQAIDEARRYKRETINVFIASLERVVEVYVAKQGTATLRAGGFTMTAPKKTTYERDLPAMKQALAEAGVPKERLDKAIAETIVYKADGTVLRQLAGANPAYKEAIDAHTKTTEEPRKVSVKFDG